MTAAGFAYEKPKSQSTTWLTPPWILEALGRFDLDPCGYPGYVTADHVVHAPADGLADPWYGRVWLNPPYGKGVEIWMKQLWLHGVGTALLPARTETKWFQASVHQAKAALFLEKRVAFLKPEGGAVNNNTVGSVLLAYGAYDAEKLLRSGLAGWSVRQF